MAPLWLTASKKIKQADISHVPYLAMASAFTFMVMIFAIPLPGGTTGHICGAALIAILLGPWSATLAVSVSLMIQAFVFGDGGITSIGANCFNIAFVGSFTGCGVYRLIKWVGGFLPNQRTKLKNDISLPLSVQLFGAALASYAAINAGALCAAIELGLQPMLHGVGGASLYFPFDMKVTLPAVMIPHLTAIGALEAVATTAVFALVIKAGPKSIKGFTRTTIGFAAALALLLGASWATAHDFWIEKKGTQYVVVFGHGSQREDFDFSKIKTIKAYDLHGKPMAITKEDQGKLFLLKPAHPPSIIAVEIDNGYWSKTIYGWKNLPKRQASRVVETIRSFYYSKALVSWNEIAQQASPDAIIDIIPLKSPLTLGKGESFPLKVLYLGKPLKGAEIETGDHDKKAVTDGEGIASIRVLLGHQVVSATKKEKITNDPDADFITITSTLTFEVAR
jgi:cobalt/nickel transport system permease protein